jgi:hypothetical protein
MFNLEESDILLVMLGSLDQDIIQELSPDLWSIILFYIALKTKHRIEHGNIHKNS